MKKYITIGKDTNGEWDFEVSAMVETLDFSEIKKMRSMIITAIYVVEDIWRREQNKKEKPGQLNKN